MRSSLFCIGALLLSFFIGTAKAQQTQVLRFDPTVGPICASPLGPGPCAAIQQYLLQQQQAAQKPSLQFDPKQVQVIGNDPGVGPICNGPFGPGPCALVQQYLLEHPNPAGYQSQRVGQTANFSSAQQLAIECAQRSGLDVSLFATCTGGKVILRQNEQALLNCAMSSRTTQDFSACAAPWLGIRLSNEQRLVAQCAMRSNGDSAAFYNCALPSIGQAATSVPPAALICARNSNDDPSRFASCSAEYVLGPHASREQMIALACAAQAKGNANVMASCSGANLFNLQLNPEQQIVVQCVVSAGGQPYAAAGCMATRLTAQELVKCKTAGFGGSSGCFGTDVATNSLSARAISEIAGGPNSIIRNAAQIWGGDNSFVRDPIKTFEGSNSFVRNPGQFWGGNNSVFNNPAQLSPHVSAPGQPDEKRICVPWCPTTSDIKALQPVYYATNRKINDEKTLQARSFTAERSMQLNYGLAIVSVPKNHVIGNVERPAFNYFKWGYDKEVDADHFRISSISPLERDKFVDELRTSSAESLLLFIHGYNVPFQDAIFKGAQIAYDANFGGRVLVFAWPSAGEFYKYDYDRESAEFSGGDLLAILRIVTQEIGNKRIYVVAHSLGNQVLIDALQQAALSKVALNISELVLAAPDVDKDVFMKKADEIRSVAKNITMYASSADKALLASDKKAWGARLGYIDSHGPHLAEGVETIDVTAVGDDMLGLDHSTFSGSRSVLDDLGRLIRSTTHQSPIDRSPTLQFMPDKEHVKYWLYPR
jgi:esterase/lipase superfamily enzyme